MTMIKSIAATSIAVVAFAVALSALPSAAHAVSAPRCVFNTIVNPDNNGGTTLSWKAYNAHTVRIGGIGHVRDADAKVVYPDRVTVYTLTAIGNGGTTTCEAVAQPVSAYPYQWPFQSGAQQPKTCSMWVEPDLVVPGGTAVLNWRATGADRVWLDHGIGNMSNAGSRTVPGPGARGSDTYTMNAEWSDGTRRTCSATVRSTSASPYSYSGGYTTPGYTPYQQRPAYQSVSLSHVPYTGPNDALYVGLMTALFALSSAGAWFVYQRNFANRRRLA